MTHSANENVLNLGMFVFFKVNIEVTNDHHVIRCENEYFPEAIETVKGSHAGRWWSVYI